jgi:hypothetical protein
LPGDRTPAQQEFFRAIRRKAPWVLQSLNEKLLPRFQRYRTRQAEDKHLFDLYGPAWDWAAAHHIVNGDRLYPVWETCCGISDTDGTARAAAFEGSSEETFFFPWAFFAIWGTLKNWHDNPKEANRDWVLPYWPYPIEDASKWLMMKTRDPSFKISDLFSLPKGRQFQFRCPSWNPLRETRAHVRHRIINAVKKEIDVHLDEATKLMELMEAKRVPVRQSREHFDWLVIYQVNCKSYAEIAKHHLDVNEGNRQTVTDGVKSAAEQVVGRDWKRWLRPSPPGRPKAS